MPHLDWSINFGNVLTLAGFLAAIYKFHTSSQERTNQMHLDNIQMLTAINTKLDIMWKWFTESQIGNR